MAKKTTDNNVNGAINAIAAAAALLSGNAESDNSLFDELYGLGSASKSKNSTAAETAKEVSNIEKRAEFNLADEYGEKINTITKKYQAKQTTLNDKLSKKLSTTQEQQQAAVSDYISDNHEILDKIVNNGMKNSTVFDSLKKENEEKLNEKLSILKADYEIYNNSVSEQINKLNLEKRQALLERDFEYALKKEKEMENLRNEQTKLLKQIAETIK